MSTSTLQSNLKISTLATHPTSRSKATQNLGPHHYLESHTSWWLSWILMPMKMTMTMWTLWYFISTCTHLIKGLEGKHSPFFLWVIRCDFWMNLARWLFPLLVQMGSLFHFPLAFLPICSLCQKPPMLWHLPSHYLLLMHHGLGFHGW